MYVTTWVTRQRALSCPGPFRSSAPSRGDRSPLLLSSRAVRRSRRQPLASPPAALLQQQHTTAAAAAAASVLQDSMWGWAVAGAVGGAAVAGGATLLVVASRHLTEPPAAGSAGERRAQLDAIADGFRDKQFSGVPEMTSEELAQLAAAGQPATKLVIVDVRTPEEQAVSMVGLQGVPVVTADEFERDRQRWRGHQAVCHCTVGYRSGQFAQKLLKEAGGETSEGDRQPAAYNLRGGILAYVSAMRLGVVWLCTAAPAPAAAPLSWHTQPPPHRLPLLSPPQDPRRPPPGRPGHGPPQPPRPRVCPALGAAGGGVHAGCVP
jgi:rhodanese-related sulfurtransferase